MPQSKENIVNLNADLPATRNDGWGNIATGMGTKRDKAAYTSYSHVAMLDIETLNQMYAGDGLVTSIIDIRADDVTREWGHVVGDKINKDKRGVIQTEMDRLNTPSVYNLAKKWARLQGGSLIFIGAMDGKPVDTPLNTAKIRNIEYLRVYDLGDIMTAESTFTTDPSSPNFGKIEVYTVRNRIGNQFTTTKIHYTRCIPIFGRKVPTSASIAAPTLNERYWGISEIQPAWEYLRAFANAFGSVSTVLMELIIGKYKFSQLDEMLANGTAGLSAFKTRMESIELTKSTIHSVFLGEDEDYTRDTANLSSIPDVLDRFMMNVSAVTKYPVTKLFGRSPSGLNATGEGDSKNYNESVRSDQRDMTPCVQQLVKIIAEWKGIKGDVQFVWNNLVLLTDEQKMEQKRKASEAFRTRADGFQIYVNAGILTPEEAYSLTFENVLGPKDFEDLPEYTPPPGTPEGNPEEKPIEEEEKEETPPVVEDRADSLWERFKGKVRAILD